MANSISIIGHVGHGSRGGRRVHQQDQVITRGGLMKALTSGSHNNAEWMQLIIEFFEVWSTS